MGCGKSILRSTRTCYKRDESLYWRLGEIADEEKWPKKPYSLLAKYGGLSLYDIDFEEIYSIYDGDIKFVKGYGYASIGYLDHPDGT